LDELPGLDAPTVAAQTMDGEERIHEMPTDSFKKLLDRDFAKIAAKPIIDVASPLLTEVVNVGTWVFQRCQVSIGRGTDSEIEKDEGQHLAPFILYRQLIEMADGVEILTSNSCSEATLPLLRSMLETLLSLDYMFRKDYKRRSLSWLCAYVHKRIANYERADPTTDRGRELKKTLEREGGYGAATISSSEPVKKLQGLLAGELSVIESEYQRQKKSRKRTPNWYSLFGGPSNMRDLAREVSKEGYYDLLYQDWSSVTHATDVSRFLTTTSGGGGGFHPVRYPENLKDYTWLAASFLVIATGMMMQKFRSDEDLSHLYSSKVKERLDHLRNLNVEMEPIKD
jgi:hypothetical protein